MRDAHTPRPALGDAALTGALATVAGGLLMKAVGELGTRLLGLTAHAAFGLATAAAYDALT